MEMMGNAVHAVETGTKTLKELPLMLRLEHGWRIWYAFTFWVCRLALTLTQQIVHEFKRWSVKKVNVKSWKKRRPFAGYVIAVSVVALMPSVQKGSRLDWGQSSWSWLGHRSTHPATKAIGVVDGMNLCSLWHEWKK